METTTYEDFEALCDAEPGDLLFLRAHLGRHWMAWADQDGEWWAIRPRDDDDEPAPAGDEWRPIGPVDVEQLTFPIQCRPAHAAFRPEIAVAAFWLAPTPSPTTEVIRAAVTYPRTRLGEPRTIPGAEFDRWLAARDEAVRISLREQIAMAIETDLYSHVVEHAEGTCPECDLVFAAAEIARAGGTQ